MFCVYRVVRDSLTLHELPRVLCLHSSSWLLLGLVRFTFNTGGAARPMYPNVFWPVLHMCLRMVCARPSGLGSCYQHGDLREPAFPTNGKPNEAYLKFKNFRRPVWLAASMARSRKMASQRTARKCPQAQSLKRRNSKLRAHSRH